MPIDEIVFAVSCSVTVTDEFELQLTKMGDKARNWMTMFQNWSTKDKIETSIRTFQSVRDEIESTFSKIEWRDDENGRENLYYDAPNSSQAPVAWKCLSLDYLNFRLFSMNGQKGHKHSLSSQQTLDHLCG